MGWRDWSSWLDLYRKWVELYGEEEVRMSMETLKAVYEWFIREAGDRAIEELHIDLLLDPSMTFEDAKKVLKSALEKPLSFEEMRELQEEKIRQLKGVLEKLREGTKRG